MATTESAAACTTENAPLEGLYLVKFYVGHRGMPGAPVLHVQALVDAPSGKISGQAEIRQAITPPNGNIVIRNVTGQIRSLGFGKAVRVVTLQGTYPYTLPPPAIGTIMERFSATLAIEQSEWTGQGSFSYGGHEVDDVPVGLED